MLSRRAFVSGALLAPLMPSATAQISLPWNTRLIQAARKQIGVTRTYDPAYTSLSYPLGDVPRERGVCTDVIIRAYRDAFDRDLQVEVHEDMRKHFSAYPKIWGLTRADRNIDHRRVPNLERYLKRQGLEQALPERLSDWKAGDLFTMRLSGRLPHIAIVSDRASPEGHPLVIHNIGSGTREENLLGMHQYPRRFRMPPTHS